MSRSSLKYVKRNHKALTLVEVMVAIVILSIAVTGSLGYQYYAAKQARIAKIELAATHIAHLLLEDWKSTGGSGEYATNGGPLQLGLGFTEVSDVPDVESEGIPGNTAQYGVIVDGIPMLVILAYGDVDYDESTHITLRELAVAVHGDFYDSEELNLGQVVSAQVSEVQSAGFGTIKPVTLTTYVRLDGGGG